MTAPTLIGTPAATHNEWLNTLTVSLTVPAGAKILLVGAMWGGLSWATTCTWDSEALTRRGGVQVDGTNDGTTEVFYRLDPPAKTANLYVVWPGSHRCALGGACYKDVAGNPFGAADATATAKASASVSAVQTSKVGNLVVDHGWRNGSECQAYVGAGQTQVWNQYIDPGSGSRSSGFSSYEAGAASVTMSWTSLTYTAEWCLYCVDLAAKVPGSQVVWMMAKRMRDFMHDLRQGLIPPDLLQRRWAGALRPI